ncbi:MAG: TatD family hydrolase [Cytophagales bacterium]|nr:TatD family hydrolase [Bernardetiaceae bacterium]MDW8204409.1 TatD family hydrolase [Cytophagales bacterium]
MIDTHAHIYSKQFDGDRAAMLARTFAAGVEKILMPNVDSESVAGMMELAAQYPAQCFPMMGLHPCSVDANFEKELQMAEDWLSKYPFIAIGEMGLDLYWDKTYFEQQKESFRIQATWAKTHGLPLVVHCREAMPETLALLETLADERLFGVLHCFTGTAEEAARLYDMNFRVGIGGVITYKKGDLAAVVAHIPLEQIVLETDSPYLAPVPYRGKRNETSYLPLIAEKVASAKQMSLTEIASATTKNAIRLFFERKPTIVGQTTQQATS